MANEEHIKMLKQGVAQWDEWRRQYQAIQPNLCKADLNGADLNRANLSGTDLSRAHLNGADLSRANLSGADLSRAHLNGADLSRANLSGADLRGADLSGTDLSDANLSFAHLMGVDLIDANLSCATLSGTDLDSADLNGADLSDANLSFANLSGANLSHTNLYRVRAWSTTFAHLDLREVQGLIEISHQGSSRVELHTIQLPQDDAAVHFLRGAGIPDAWIDFYMSMMPSLQYHSCFISYAHKDEMLAHRLHADLQDHGVRCWFAPHDMHIGDKIRPRIDEAIHLQDKLLLILSEHSVASDWVEHEVETALARERRDRRTILFPIRLDNASIICTLRKEGAC